MEQLDEAVKSLIRVMKETQEYQCYQQNASVIREDEAVKSKVDELRSLSYRMQNMSDDGLAPEVEEHLEERFEELCEDSRVHDFMQAEIDFCRMFQNIMMQITQGMDFE